MSKPVVSSDFYLTNVSTLAAGGIGYSVGNILTLVGGTFTTSAQITVTTVATNVITGFTVSRGGVYSIVPVAPFTFTGGAGTGASINAVFSTATPGFTPILIYGTNQAGTQPALGSLGNRELFVDTATPSLFVGGTLNSVVRLIGSLGSQAANAVAITGGTIAVTADPTSNLQVATKQYVDALPIGGFPYEPAVIQTTAFTATQNFDLKTSEVLYSTVNATNNVTINFRGDAATTLATFVPNNNVLSCVVAIQNGVSAFYIIGFTIDGVAITAKWPGGVIPTAGTSISTDFYAISIFKNSAGMFSMTANQSAFR